MTFIIVKKFNEISFLLAFFSLFFINCQKGTATGSKALLPFKETPDTSFVNPGVIDEASGIADSKSNPGLLWVQQDSGNPPELALLSYNGIIQKKIYLKGSQNRDWEDIAVGSGPEPGKNYIYVAEIGDNNAVYPDYALYRFIEPLQAADTVYAWDKITFQYPDGSHDAEAIIIDNDTKDIYILTKESKSGIYKLTFPQSTTVVNAAIYAGEMKISGLCSAAISPDGKELLAKNYTNVYYWKRNNGESIVSALLRMPATAGYVVEPQGEAICFKNDNSAFYTLSEKPFFAASVSLNLYKRQ
jgi:hypothetical protein